MTSHLSPYLSFNGNAREAMEFYADVLGAQLNVTTFGEFGQDGPAADLVMHAQLEAPNGFRLMGADTPPGVTFQPPAGIAVALFGDDDDLQDHWNRLSDGGTVVIPLEKQAWGDAFGMCTDRFGIGWMVNISQRQD